MDYFAIGKDKTLKETYTREEVEALVNGFLSLAGGYMTGNIGYASGSRNGWPIRFVSGDANGSGIVIGDGGTTVVGGGEAASQFAPADGSGATETLILASDTTIKFYTNAQSGASSAKLVELSTAGLLSGHQKAITSGTAAPSGGSNGDIYIQY